MRQTRCVDCNEAGAITDRPALNPGPRCDEHWRAKKKVRSKVAHSKRIEKNFSIDGDIYDALKRAQGGKCFGCQRATGKTKNLAVDHDHECDGGHDPKMGCIKCIRALLCGYCNQIIGRLDVPALQRLIEVLTDPPAQRFLRSIMVISDDMEDF